MIWTQNYNPTGSAWLSTLLAALPLVVLLGLLGLRGWPAPRAAAAGLVAAVAVAIGVYRMPATMAGAAALYGACFGLLPIGWIVLAAVFLYNLTVAAGRFEIVKASVASLSVDRRIQAILIAFCFGAFIEGAAGFGTPVAISAALMIGAGFSPLYAAGLALLANTAPVAFGALGTPITTLARVTGIDEGLLSAMAGRQLPFFSLIVPAWMVVTMSGWRGLAGVWPAVLVSGGSFAAVQFAVANWWGPTLVDVAGGLASLVALALFLKFWQPKTVWRFPDEAIAESSMGATAGLSSSAPSEPAPRRERTYSAWEITSAWVPWLLLSAAVFVWGLPDARAWFDRALGGAAVFEVPISGLHERVLRAPPAAPSGAEAERAILRVNWLSTTGTGILVAAILSAAWMGISPRRFVVVFWRTLVAMRWPLATIAMMLAIAYVTRYCGSDVTLGLAFTHTGALYPFFAAMLGWLGVALTGSDTSSNALFGSLQKVTAEQLGLNPVLIAAANSTGGVMGKMIDAQSIVVASAATGQSGGEGPILRFVFWHSLALAALMGLLTMLQAHWWTWMIPG
ncbi:MAG: lactate permease LctP family transporter [Pirellulales bacterium]|nr:lactate permease LctP family transporter [Pirellulales bacterium]